MSVATERLIGHVGVDAGCVVVGDPCYLVDTDLTWEQVCEAMFDESGHRRPGVEDTTAVEVAGTLITGTPNGDGQFPVYAEVDDDGQVTSLRIDLADHTRDEKCEGCGFTRDDCACCHRCYAYPCECDEEEG